MNCNPSANLEREFADRSSEAAAEGSAAHALCEHKLRKALKMRSTRPVSKYEPEVSFSSMVPTALGVMLAD